MNDAIVVTVVLFGFLAFIGALFITFLAIKHFSAELDAEKMKIAAKEIGPKLILLAVTALLATTGGSAALEGGPVFLFGFAGLAFVVLAVGVFITLFGLSKGD